jgi:hypothetical protein
MSRLDVERNELRAFTCDVLEESQRTLELLRQIDNTLGWLDRLEGLLHTDTSFAEKLQARVKASSCEVDPDDLVVPLLEKAQRAVSEMHDVLFAKRESARLDIRLTEDDGIEAGYTRVIAASADLHNALNSLRWAIMEHDVNVVPEMSETYSNVDDLIDALRQ